MAVFASSLAMISVTLAIETLSAAATLTIPSAK
jgi:hypothetical protein